MTSPAKPLLLYDGTCAFCRAWIARWRRVTGERVEVAAYQEAAARAPGIAAEELARAVHLVEPGGRVTRGAEAVFRSLAYTPGHGAGLALYRRLPGFARVSEACYAWVASHRPLGERITRIVWGPHVVPPGERTTSWLFLRVLGVVFLIAFLSLWTQIIGLVGREGILPAEEALRSLRAVSGPERYWLVPTLAWAGAGDATLHGFCAAGVALAALLAAGVAPAASLVGCWVLYLSLVVVGRDFLSFQWDTLLLETGLLAVFLAPLRFWSRPGSDPPLSRLALWALRALLFRLFVSSAVVKLASGDPSWRDLTALTFHYETQCLPPWTAWVAHQLPAWFQRASAGAMFGIEGLIPFLIVAPRRIRFAAAWAMIGFQATIALTGNYGFFNLLSAALCLLLLDDGVWPWRWRGARRSASEPAGEVGEGTARERPGGRWPGWLLRPALVVLLLVGLVPMARAFRWPTVWLGPLAGIHHLLAPFRSVNGYGLFSVMTTRRPEIVLETSDDGITWRDVAFCWKPGDPARRPAFVAPHQPRLDWQMWFAALGDYRNEPWFLVFCERLLQGSRPVWALLAADPPPRPPRYLRALLYDYRFTDAATRRATGAWWRRNLQGLYCPVLTLRDGRLSPAPAGFGVP
ncbi:MAG: lipase maturation factor family protein [Candidatus Eiseniibacteriota bacterium]